MSAAQGASPAHHSVAFRVMRLCRPSLQAEDAVLRLLDPLDLLAAEDLLDDPALPADSVHRLSDPATPDAAAFAAGDFTFRDRFQIRHPMDAMALSGLLVVPQSFGNIYLGETFSSYISVNNSSKFEAREVVIKAEIQTERQKIILLDTSKAPVESIRSGGRYDFIVEHDVKELGPHTLICTAFYNDGDSERKYLPQFFKFIVNNPLSVRTKVRTIKDNTYLEACIENHTKSNLYMDQVEFEPAPQWISTRLEADDCFSETNSTTSVAHSLHYTNLNIYKAHYLDRGIFKPPVLIRAGGGIYNYLYLIKSAEESGQGKVDGSIILGKFQITWRTNLGEPGRLQTQQIYGTPNTQRSIDLRILDIPPVIILERPFQVHISLTNHTERTLGPFEVFISSEISSGEEKTVMINGIQKSALPPVEAYSSNIFDLNMIATKLGVQKISGITLFDVREKKYYEPLPDIEIFVEEDR